MDQFSRIILDQFSHICQLHPTPTRAVRCALLGARAERVLIGALEPDVVTDSGLKAMKKKVSGSLKTALVSILDVARDPTSYWAERLHKALDGQMLGTHDTSLIHIIVGRAEVDLSTIEAIYASTHGKALQVSAAATAATAIAAAASQRCHRAQPALPTCPVTTTPASHPPMTRPSPYDSPIPL